MVRNTQDLLKEGSRHFTGLEEAMLRNTKAVKELSEIVRTSLGPFGMKKIIINSTGKLFVTADAATILGELEVLHPAAKMTIFAAEMQEKEIGDATNLVIVFTGELMNCAEELLLIGVHPSDIISGFEKAFEKFESEISTMTLFESKDLKNEEEISKCLKTVIGSKISEYESEIADLVAKACISVLPKTPKYFNVDNVRAVKILGGSVGDSKLIPGIVLLKSAEGSIQSVEKAKVAVFGSGLAPGKTEGTSKLALKDAEQLKNYAKSEEDSMESIVKAIADAGVKCVVSGGKIGEMAMHFLEKYEIMAVYVQSKFELRRICRATGARPLVRQGAPTPEELGHCDKVYQDEIGSHKVILFQTEGSGISSLIIRAGTSNILDDVERAVNDGVNIFKAMTRDAKFVGGGGATEIELAKRIHDFGEAQPGEEQYSIKKFAEALEIVPKTLGSNSGIGVIDLISELYTKHSNKDGMFFGVNVNSKEKTIDVKKAGIFDHYEAKLNAIKLATNTAITILRIDQIIMSKPASGPMPAQGPPPGMAPPPDF